MSTITIELQNKQYGALLEIASQEKKSEHQICLEAIEEYLIRKEDLTKGRAAMLRLGKGFGIGKRQLRDYRFHGMWKDKTDMANSAEWVRKHRESWNERLKRNQ